MNNKLELIDGQHRLEAIKGLENNEIFTLFENKNNLLC